MASSSGDFYLSSFPYKFLTLASSFNNTDSISWLLVALRRWSNLIYITYCCEWNRTC